MGVCNQILNKLIFPILDDCTKEDGARCINGACLSGVCHCNDGFGGCNCQEPGKLTKYSLKINSKVNVNIGHIAMQPSHSSQDRAFKHTDYSNASIIQRQF